MGRAVKDFSLGVKAVLAGAAGRIWVAAGRTEKAVAPFSNATRVRKRERSFIMDVSSCRGTKTEDKDTLDADCARGRGQWCHKRQPCNAGEDTASSWTYL